ncbi:hypothetical protein [uncultured Sphingomonas sp.]|uniref:hypothetical protein n=1 Tax=uncultured Sphingomonas sp. TaxID=158754 RepID=UPI002631D79A|nr:hypothetical protein [uncultured Sphingomonas sp.]
MSYRRRSCREVGKPNGGGEDGGRGESLALSEEEVEPANVANNLAANILSQPSEAEVDNSRDGLSSEATVVSSAEARSPADRGRTSDDERDDRSRSMDGRSAPVRVAGTNEQLMNERRSLESGQSGPSDRHWVFPSSDCERCNL